MVVRSYLYYMTYLKSIQLGTLVSDEVSQKCLDLFTHAQRNGGAGGLCASSHLRMAAEIAYQKQAEKAFADENCIKVTVVSVVEKQAGSQ
jgi:hypothetical protein